MFFQFLLQSPIGIACDEPLYKQTYCYTCTATHTELPLPNQSHHNGKEEEGQGGEEGACGAEAEEEPGEGGVEGQEAGQEARRGRRRHGHRGSARELQEGAGAVREGGRRLSRQSEQAAEPMHGRKPLGVEQQERAYSVRRRVHQPADVHDHVLQRPAHFHAGKQPVEEVHVPERAHAKVQRGNGRAPERYSAAARG